MAKWNRGRHLRKVQVGLLARRETEPVQARPHRCRAEREAHGRWRAWGGRGQQWYARPCGRPRVLAPDWARGWSQSADVQRWM